MAASSGDAHPWPIYNARYRVVLPILDADGDLVTAAASLDSEASQDQGTFADCTNEATEIATSSGVYYLDLISTELDTKCTAVIVKTATAGAKTTVLTFYPQRFPVIRTGTAQAGGASTVTLDSGASAVDDYYNGTYVNITNNSPANALGQARRITDYVGSTKVATVEAAWGTNPSSASTFEILLPGDIAGVGAWAGTAVDDPATVGIPDVNTITLASGSITAAVIATGAVDADAIADNAIDAGAIAADAITAAKIANGAIDALTFAAGAIDAAALAADAGVEIAAAVWNEDATNHQTTGTFGQAIGDPIADTNTIYAATVTNATGTTIAADIIAIQADTDDMQTRLPAALVSGRIDASVGAMAANVVTAAAVANGAIDAATFAAGAIDATAIADGAIDAATFAAGAINAAAVAADAIGASELATDAVNEIRDAVWAQALTEATAVPSITGTMKAALEWLFMLGRNKITQTATTQLVRNDADAATVGTSTVSDDATTFIRGKFL